ncbi:hypothetical protein SH139x_002591 [Planctomycetaceae bacterium SH139]
MASNRREQIVESVSIVLDSGTAKPTGGGSASTGEYHASDHDWQPKCDAGVKHAAHGLGNVPQVAPQRHVGPSGVPPLGVRPDEPHAIVALRTFCFVSMLCLRRFASRHQSSQRLPLPPR